MILNNGLAGTNMQEFESKRKLLFDCLESAEKDLIGTNLSRSSSSLDESEILEDGNSMNNQRKISKFHGKESIFKKPELPITKCLKPRSTPDYWKNPHKWKKYSLSDIDISDHTNTAAAFAFLKDIEIQKDREQSLQSLKHATEKSLESSPKPVFNKSVGLQMLMQDDKNNTDPIDRPKLKGAKLVMPEYSFATKKHSTKKLKFKNISSIHKNDEINKSNENLNIKQKIGAKQLRLSHLEEQFDD